MPGYLTSYAGLFSPRNDSPTVTSIEIPLIQRDYAQGRLDAQVTDIRERFLDVLFEALAGDERVGLDFVYGEVEDGTLRPLDGQQRLTTLFLLHWYFGYRTEQLSESQPWMAFSYATRPSARLFCEQLVTATPAPDEKDPGTWIEDQPWFLYVWSNDPTIQAMLVMIRAIHKRFADCDPVRAWERLASADSPIISFQLLPIDDMGSGEDLYIKMNSRGKPLTAFENFKARFERAIVWAGDKAREFDFRVDGPWADILWRSRGSDDVVDDEFLRYFAFITDVCEWRLGRIPSGRPEDRALQLFGTEGSDAEASLAFLFHAFDTWVGTDIDDEFKRIFTAARADPTDDPQRLLLFGTDGNVNLFDACCRAYGTGRFPYGRTLLLLAVLLNRQSPSEDFPRRLRVVRNLVEASESEFRPYRLPALVGDVHRIIVDGSLDVINGFNKAQAEDEQAKWRFVAAHPEAALALFRLEDHQLLRGSLQSFDLDTDTFARRAAAFESLMAVTDHWRDVTGALLAAGNYARRRNDRDLQFGSPSNTEPWRTLLTGTSRANLEPTAQAFGRVLDAVSSGATTRAALRQMRETFLRAREAEEAFDWRYYMVRYDAMRDGASGIYASVGGNMGYLVCMLNKTQMNGRYRDPYLTALAGEAGVAEERLHGAQGPLFMGGYVDDFRWLELSRSRTALRCAADGWILRPPTREEFLEPFQQVCAEFDVDQQMKVAIPQQLRDGRRVDTVDRIQEAALLVGALVAAGL